MREVNSALEGNCFADVGLESGSWWHVLKAAAAERGVPWWRGDGGTVSGRRRLKAELFEALGCVIVQGVIVCRERLAEARRKGAELAGRHGCKYEEHGREASCAICCGGSEEVGWLVLPCEHAYHVECVRDWIERPELLYERPTCPYCRSEFGEEKPRLPRLWDVADRSGGWRVC